MATSDVYARPERRAWRPSPVLVGAAALALAAVTFVTVCPIGLRPHLGSANLERFAAFFAVGLIVGRAAGRRLLAAATLVAMLAIALEAAQHFVPTRHAHVSDAMVKALGGVLGCAAIQLAFAVRRGLARTPALRPGLSEGRP